MRGLAILTRAIRSRPSLVEKAVRTLLAVAVPTFLRWAMVGDAYGAPFVLYFPAILMIAVLIGWRSAVVTTVASAIVAVYMFWPPAFVAVGRQQVLLLLMFALSGGTMIAIGQLLRDAVLTIDAQVRQSEEFNRELQHRTKNSIQMMRALASQASKATDPEEFYDTLGGRLAALAKANELLRFGALEKCDMDDLMRKAIAPFNGAQIHFAGPPCCVSRDGCTPLMMALHELGTNASKYGALSVETGRVDIRWWIGEGDESVVIDWTETGGPAVTAPTRKGIGARLLSASGGVREVTVDYRPEGVACQLVVAQE